MNQLNNARVLFQTRWDSGAVNGLSAVAHRLAAPGQHHLTILKGAETIGEFPVTVLDRVAEDRPLVPAPECDAPAAAAPLAQRRQLRINLASLRAPGALNGATPHQPPFEARPNGYAIFEAPEDEVGYTVIAKAPAGTAAEPFDSRRLCEGDYYLVNLLRPGVYRVINALTGAQGRIVMAYPVIGATPYRPPDPLTIVCAEQGFDPPTAILAPAQGLAFQFKVPSRIEIELVEPDDGPAKRAG